MFHSHDVRAQSSQRVQNPSALPRTLWVQGLPWGLIPFISKIENSKKENASGRNRKRLNEYQSNTYQPLTQRQLPADAATHDLDPESPFEHPTRDRSAPSA